MKIKSIIIMFLTLYSGNILKAQELNATVDIMYDRIQNVDQKLFSNLKTQLLEFLNNRKWTNDYYQVNEKIHCSFFINVTETIGDPANNTFKGTITVAAARPVYNTNYSSPTFNFLDRDFAFRYDPASAIIFDENRVGGSEPLQANLSAVVAYYVYIVLGLDYDSYSKFGGTPFFKKAQNIVMNAPEDTRTINGWKANDQNKRNRYFLADQIMSSRFSDLREFWYVYHRQYLDMLRSDQKMAVASLIPYFQKIKQVNSENPSSIFMQLIFNAKSSELQDALATFPMEDRNKAADILAQVDISNANKYRNQR